MKIALLFGALACFALPIVSFIYLRKKSSNLTGPFIAGMVTFYLFQLVLRIPVLQAVLPNYEWYSNMSFLQTALFLGITAALFETVGRFIVMKFLLKDKQSYYSAISHGIGHGGIEAVLLVGINYIVYITFTFMITKGTFDNLLVGQEQLVIDQLLYIKDFLTEGNAALILVAILERIFTFVIQIGLSVMVMEGIVTKKYKLIALVFLIHMFIDTSVSFLALKEVNLYLIEGIVLAFAVLSGFYIIKAKKRFKDKLEVHEKNEKYINSDY